jgi:KaiC/GvpD/RAD55 family RecA-like ATPase
MTTQFSSSPVALQSLPSLKVSSSAPTDARIPTGVGDFDSVAGGIPVGSVVLLTGEAGAGHQEFALTSATHLMFSYDAERMHKFYLGSVKGNFVYPAGVAYVSLSRSRDQVVREIEISFEPSHHASFVRHLIFHDLSSIYFSDTVVPRAWAQTSAPLLAELAEGSAAPSTTDPLEAIVRAVEQDGNGNVVIVDSLTDLLVRRNLDTEAILTLVKGLRRRAKDWGGVVYLLLSRGVAPTATEQALADSVDGVFSFTWTTHPLRSTRQRTMLIEKFMPVLSHVPHEHQGRFVIRVSALTGLVTTQYERI